MFRYLAQKAIKFLSKYAGVQEAKPAISSDPQQDPLVRYDIYLPQERLIFHYFDGEKMVAEDPMVIYKRVMDRGAELASDQKAASNPMSKFARPAHETLLKNIREIFNVKPLTPTQSGLTEFETVELLDSFLMYAHLIKKNSSPTTTGQTEVSLPTSPPSSEAKDQATPSSSDSGSIASETSTDKQPQSHSEPVLHSDSSSPEVNTSPQ